MEVCLLDDSNNIIEEVNMIKPKYYKDLLISIKNKFKNIKEYYEIFIIDENNKEIIINNNNIYSKIKDILFIRLINKNILEQSLYEINYNKLSESKQELLDEKYNCILCSMIIKNENPYYCYECQKIYHEKCLKDWNNKCKKEYKNFSCPNCRNELSIEKWNKKLDYENNRKYDTNIMNKINEYKLNNNINNIIKEKKIKKYEIYINKTFNIFKNVFIKLNDINKILKLNNNLLNNIINNFSLNIDDIEIDNLSNIFNDELEKIKNYIKLNQNKGEKDFQNQNQKINNDEKSEPNLSDNPKIKLDSFINKKDQEENLNQMNEIKHKESKLENISNMMNNNNQNNIINYIIGKIKIKKEDINKNIRIINSYEEYLRSYSMRKSKDNYYYIYGNEKEIKENIILEINNTKINFHYYYKFNAEGEYIIKYIFKKFLTKANHLFSDCYNIISLDFTNFDTQNITYMSCMFKNCRELKNLNLSNFNSQNVTNMDYMFENCRSLINLDLYNFNTQNVTDMCRMFKDCYSLINLNLSNFNTQNVTNMLYMFKNCRALINLNLSNFNTQNVTNMSYMFENCKSLTHLNLSNFNTQNAIDIIGMFFNCSSLKINNIITKDKKILDEYDNK